MIHIGDRMVKVQKLGENIQTTVKIGVIYMHHVLNSLSYIQIILMVLNTIGDIDTEELIIIFSYQLELVN